MAYRITLIPGDGIGPEVVDATLKILAVTGLDFDWEVHHAGLEVARLTGTPLPPSVIEAVRKNKVALKGPVTTPIGHGFRSVNVTLRQTLDLYANVRPVRSLPNVEIVFDVFYRHYAQYQDDLAAWEARYGQHAPAPVATVDPGPATQSAGK